MNIRLIASVAKRNKEPPVKHYIGIPPQLIGGQDYRQQLPYPCVLLIEEKPEGVFLFRFNKDKICCGDTWHLSVDDAKEQAVYEYEGLLSEWHNVPTNIDDAVGFALDQMC